MSSKAAPTITVTPTRVADQRHGLSMVHNWRTVTPPCDCPEVEVWALYTGRVCVSLARVDYTLRPVDASVQTVTLGELGVGSLLENAAMVKHHHDVRLREGQQAMREQHDRAPPRMRLRRAIELAQAGDYPRFGVEVQCRERVVEDEQPRRR